MDETSKKVLIGLAVVVALCVAYYFVLRPMIKDGQLEKCLRPGGDIAIGNVGVTQQTRDNCFRQYGR